MIEPGRIRYQGLVAPPVMCELIMRELSKTRCEELAALPELRVNHWEELTGAGICEGGSYDVKQDGVFPEQFSDRDLQRLTQEDRYILLEHSNIPPLRFPCTPSQLLKFVDGDASIDFEVPEKFRAAVEGISKTSEDTEERRPLLESATRPPLKFPCTPNQLPKFVDGDVSRDVDVPDNSSSVVEACALLVQKDGEQNTSPEAPEIAEPSKAEQGVTKGEILATDWPMPNGAPSLASILDKIPKWVETACKRVGRAGKGASGSHLWLPAQLGVCLGTTTPHKQWKCTEQALTKHIRQHYPKSEAEWENKSQYF